MTAQDYTRLQDQLRGLDKAVWLWIKWLTVITWLVWGFAGAMFVLGALVG